MFLLGNDHLKLYWTLRSCPLLPSLSVHFPHWMSVHDLRKLCEMRPALAAQVRGVANKIGVRKFKARDAALGECEPVSTAIVEPSFKRTR